MKTEIQRGKKQTTQKPPKEQIQKTHTHLNMLLKSVISLAS